MNIIYFGTPQFAVPSLESFIAAPDIDVIAVVTQPDKRRGRGNKLIPSPVKAVAIEHDIPVWQPRRIKQDEETLGKLAGAQADAFVVVAYGQILSQHILDMPRLGCINGHGSILPQYRGAAPIQWSLVHGQSETGITTMLMDVGMDTGPMLLKRTIPIGWLDTTLGLAKVLSVLSAELLVETLQGLEQGSIQPIPQDDNKATYAPLIKKDDYELDWSQSAIALHNKIRGFAPNCTTTFRKTALKIKASLPIHPTIADELIAALGNEFAEVIQTGVELLSNLEPSQSSPGTVVSLAKNVGALVMTGDGLLLLREAQLAGKRSQSGWDFVNGTRMTIGECLG
ncbi:MAG: methionyl-tRNA formyltransferase [Merismopedia sp. SIO2A8]|nr:methionyl-tRNA formyltransferase [Symploca sp. SIO2B6]NET48550.1 methionyl-tRNA formyltransferase [Merismopedia sp. SIO2A8]